MNERGAEFLRDQQAREQSRAAIAEMFRADEGKAAALITLAYQIVEQPDRIYYVPPEMIRLIGCLAAIGGTALGEQVVEAQLMEAGAL